LKAFTFRITDLFGKLVVKVRIVSCIEKIVER